MTAASIEELVRAEVRAGVDDALKPFLPRLAQPECRAYTFGQAAHVIGCSDRHVAKLVARDVLPLVPHMGTRRLIPRIAVEAFVDGQHLETSALQDSLGGASADVSTIGKAS